GSFFIVQDSNRSLAAILSSGGTRYRIGGPQSVLRTNQWNHVAAVTGPNGFKLYLNGSLLEAKDIRTSFSDFRTNDCNFLGACTSKHIGKGAPDLCGALSGVRIWNSERTPEEIHAGMFQTLTGTEAGLVGAWNLDAI